MKRKILATLAASAAALALSAAPAQAATYIRLVNQTNGNAYYDTGSGTTKHRISAGHTSATVNRNRVRMIVYSTNPYGWTGLGSGEEPGCVRPGTYYIPTGVSDGPSNQIVLLDRACR
jgi:hypothetical protein